MRARASALLALSLLVGACGTREGGSQASSCGIAAVAGPTMLLSEFATPNQTLSVPPARLPERLVARRVAGQAYPALVGRSDTSVVIGVEGDLADGPKPGFGVLVVHPDGSARGVMLFEGPPVKNAPQLGTVTMGNLVLPLIGIQLDPRKYEDPACPFFPDSLLR